MGREVGGNQGGTAEASLLSWFDKMKPCLDSLMATAGATFQLLSGREKERAERAAAVDGIRDAAQACQRWTSAYPCCDPTLGDRFGVLVARYQFVALELGTYSSKVDEANFRATVDRLNSLNAELGEFPAIFKSAERGLS